MANTKKKVLQVADHIILNALIQNVVEKIESLKDLDPLWKQRHSNASKRYLKVLDEHLNKALNGSTEEGAALQDEILIAATELDDGLVGYKKSLIKHLDG